jgi:hypothetical protein
MTKNKKPQFRTAVTDFAKSVWIVSRGRFPDRTELHAAASRAEAEEWQKLNTHPKRDRTYVAAAHVIFMNGQWWKVLANPVKLSIPHPRTPPVSLPPPPPSQSGNLGSSTLTITKVITAARWRRAEDAFYKQVEVTRHGGIQNLRGGILAALKELLS